MPAITQFVVGKLSRPSCLGSVNMMTSSVIKPGASMVNQPHFPGMLNFDSMDVLPIGYHVVIHWAAVNYGHILSDCEAYMSKLSWKLTRGKNFHIFSMSSQCSRVGGSQPSMMAMSRFVLGGEFLAVRVD